MDIVTLCIILAILIYGIYIYSVNGDLFNPILAFILPIFIGYVIFLYYYDDGVSDFTFLCYDVGLVGYTAGFFIYKLFKNYDFRVNREKFEMKLYMNHTVEIIFKVLSVVVLADLVWYYFKAATSGVYGLNYIRNIRYYGNYGEGTDFIGTYGSVLVGVLYLSLLYKKKVGEETVSRFWLWFSLFVWILGSMTTMARTAVLNLFVTIYYLYTFCRRFISKDRSILGKMRQYFIFIVLGICLVGVFTYLAVQTNKTASSYEGGFLAKYLGYNLYAFDTIIRKYPGTTYGYYSLGIIGRLLSALGLGPNSTMTDILTTRYYGQVYTFIGMPYSDFGVLGIFPVMFVFGLLHSFVYHNMLVHGGYWVIFYTSCIYSAVLAFFSFQFAMSSQVYMLVFILLLGWKNKGRLKEKTENRRKLNQYM